MVADRDGTEENSSMTTDAVRKHWGDIDVSVEVLSFSMTDADRRDRQQALLRHTRDAEEPLRRMMGRSGVVGMDAASDNLVDLYGDFEDHQWESVLESSHIHSGF